MEETVLIKEEEHKIFNWVKSHKTEIIVAGVSIAAITAFILGIKNKDEVLDFLKTVKSGANTVPLKTQALLDNNVVSETCKSPRIYTAPQSPYNVDLHIRNMSGGRHHSPEKAAEALKLGIELLPNQTIVDSYTKGLAA